MKILKRILLLLFGAFLLYVAVITGWFLSQHYPTKVAETSNYVVRHKPGEFIDPGRYCLYEKGLLWDHYLMDLTSDYLMYDLKDFQVDEDHSTVSFCLVPYEEFGSRDSCTHIILPIISAR